VDIELKSTCKINDNIIEYEDADYDEPIDYPVTWCEVLISKEGWLKKPKKI
jgi:hypothetical protein